MRRHTFNRQQLSEINSEPPKSLSVESIPIKKTAASGAVSDHPELQERKERLAQMLCTITGVEVKPDRITADSAQVIGNFIKRALTRGAPTGSASSQDHGKETVTLLEWVDETLRIIANPPPTSPNPALLQARSYLHQIAKRSGLELQLRRTSGATPIDYLRFLEMIVPRFGHLGIESITLEEGETHEEIFRRARKALLIIWNDCSDGSVLVDKHALEKLGTACDKLERSQILIQELARLAGVLPKTAQPFAELKGAMQIQTAKEIETMITLGSIRAEQPEEQERFEEGFERALRELYNRAQSSNAA